MREWLLPAMGTFVAWGLWGFIPKLTTGYISPRSAIVYEVFGGILVGLGALYSLSFRLELIPRGIALGTTTGLLGFLGGLGFLYAVSKGPVTPVVALTGLYPALSIILALLILHEPIALKQGIGIVLALIAMFLIAT